MLILLPPSEGKSAPTRGRALDPGRLSFPSLAGPRAEVLDALVGLCTPGTPGAPEGHDGTTEAAASVLGLGSTQRDDVARNARLHAAPTARADEVYSGVLYEALDVATLTPSARRRATAWIAVTSGLFGLVRTRDRIPAYRLSGDVSLPGLGTMSTFWSRHLDEAVVDAAGRGLVVDLRSSTYSSFWRPSPATARRTVTLRVLHEVDGTRKVVSHFNKATKGRIVRSMVEDGGSPGSPGRFAAHLERLGWTVETGPAGGHGTRLDVIVAEV